MLGKALTIFLSAARDRKMVILGSTCAFILGGCLVGQAAEERRPQQAVRSERAAGDTVTVLFELLDAAGRPARTFTVGDTMIGRCWVRNHTGRTIHYHKDFSPVAMEVFPVGGAIRLGRSAWPDPEVVITVDETRSDSLVTGYAIGTDWIVERWMDTWGVHRAALTPGEYALRALFVHELGTRMSSAPAPITFRAQE